MIVCPICKTELLHKFEAYCCNNCRYMAPIIEGTVRFNGLISDDYENYDAKGLDNLYQFENRHFWFKNRRDVIVRTFGKYVEKTERVIEIGAGTGNVARALVKDGYAVSVGEIHAAGLEYAKGYGIAERFQMDIFACPFQDEFDVVGMFDVLEHFEDEAAALRNVHGMLKQSGKLIITVPAHQWLWNRDDELALHKRRYTRKHLQEVLTAGGFEVVENRHFFTAIMPLLYLRTFLHRAKGNYDIRTKLQEDVFNMNETINAILDRVSRWENLLMRNRVAFIGGSIICVAQKKSF